MSSDTLTDVQKRIQNMLLNPDEQFKKAVEQGQIEIPDWEKDLFAAAREAREAREVDDTSSQDNKDFNLGDVWQTLADLVPTTGEMVSPRFYNEDLKEPNSLKDIGESFKQDAEKAKKTVEKTVKNVLPADIGKNLGLALYGILAVAGIAVFVYILSLLKPIFQIGANVSDK